MAQPVASRNPARRAPGASAKRAHDIGIPILFLFLHGAYDMTFPHF